MPRVTKRKPPKKPFKGFPLYAHKVGQWAKTIKYKTHYFGPWGESRDGDWQKALERFNAEAPDVYAGRKHTPPKIAAGGLTIKDGCNIFMEYKARQMKEGAIKERTFLDYPQWVQEFCKYMGGDRSLAGLKPLEFERFRSDLKATTGD
jgi:hypothetical protein